MAYQLVYTSSPKGLKPGAFGFCVVACTRGMKEQTAAALEALSGYRRVYSDPQSALRNPVSCSHILFDTPTGRLRVLARVADAGLDYSGRTNMIASFFEVAANELVAPGPAALFSQPGLFVERWTPADAPRYFETPAALPNVVMIPRGCDEWRRATGSAAWAGVLASTVATRRPVTLVVRPDQNVLRLFQEAIALLPPSERWNATFSTYYMKTPPGVVCQWKAAMQGSPEELALRSAPGALTINLANPSLLPSPDSLATTPQALRLVAEATGVASSDPLQRPASGKLPGARPSALSGAASIGVPNVAEIPEPRGEGYALQPQEVSVPNGASGRKKLNYGRDVVLKVDVPKTRRTSGKSLTTKFLIYALVFCLLLVSSVLVLWFAGPLRDVVKGIETRNEAVNEVNGAAGKQAETPKPADSNASDKEQAPANNNNSDQNTSKTSKPAQNNGGNGAAGEQAETPQPVGADASDKAPTPANNNNSNQSTSKTSESAQNNGGSGATGEPTETELTRGQGNTSNTEHVDQGPESGGKGDDEDSSSSDENEGKTSKDTSSPIKGLGTKSVAQQVQSHCDNVLEALENGDKDTKDKELKALDKLSGNANKNDAEATAALSRYQAMLDADKNLGACAEIGWTATDYGEQDREKKDDEIFISGEYSKKLHEALQEFLKKDSQRFVRITFCQSGSDPVDLIVKSSDLVNVEEEEPRFVGEGDVRFYSKHDEAGIWFNNNEKKCDYLLKKRIQLEAFEGDDKDLRKDDFKGESARHAKVYVTKKQPLFKVDDSNISEQIDLGWLGVEPFVIGKFGEHISFRCVTEEKSDQEKHYSFEQLTEDKVKEIGVISFPRKGKGVVLKCSRTNNRGTLFEKTEEYLIPFSFVRIASSSKIKGELLSRLIQEKEGTTLKPCEKKEEIKCTDFKFQVDLENDGENLKIGYIKIPFNSSVGVSPPKDLR